MKDWQSQAHVKWECKHHVAIIPKYRKKTLFGRSFWARGYCVSTVGLDEVSIRKYIHEQEKLQKSQEQGQLFK